MTGHGELPDEHGTASARAATGSGQKTEAGHGESDPGVAGSGQKTETGHAEKTSMSERDGNDSGRQQLRRVTPTTFSTA